MNDNSGARAQAVAHNVKLIPRWVDLYNTNIDRLVAELYAADCRIVYNGLLVINGRDELLEFERMSDEHAPGRQLAVIEKIAVDDKVVVEISAHFGDGQDSVKYGCVVLTFRDGLIVEDHTYFDTGSLLTGSPSD